MLLNKENKVAYPTDKELKRDPEAFREVLEPSTKSCGKLFQLGTRARSEGLK